MRQGGQNDAIGRLIAQKLSDYFGTQFFVENVNGGGGSVGASVTAVPRSLASSLGPALAGVLLATPFSGLPLVMCGVLKITYDWALLYSFRNVKPPEEQARSR